MQITLTKYVIIIITDNARSNKRFTAMKKFIYKDVKFECFFLFFLMSGGLTFDLLL